MTPDSHPVSTGQSPDAANLRPVTRLLLYALLKTDTDLNAFCMDHFIEVYSRFTDKMDRTSKVNLLLELAEPAVILLRLRERFRGYHDALAKITGHQAAHGSEVAPVIYTPSQGRRRPALWIGAGLIAVGLCTAGIYATALRPASTREARPASPTVPAPSPAAEIRVEKAPELPHTTERPHAASPARSSHPSLSAQPMPPSPPLRRRAQTDEGRRRVQALLAKGECAAAHDLIGTLSSGQEDVEWDILRTEHALQCARNPDALRHLFAILDGAALTPDQRRRTEQLHKEAASE